MQLVLLDYNKSLEIYDPILQATTIPGNHHFPLTARMRAGKISQRKEHMDMDIIRSGDRIVELVYL